MVSFNTIPCGYEITSESIPAITATKANPGDKLSITQLSLEANLQMKA